MKSRNIQSILIAGNRPLQKRLNVVLALSVLSLIVAISSATAFATTLNGAGQLLLPPNCPGSDCGNQLTGLFPNITQSNNAFTGVFPGNADPAYGGQFNGTGPYPTYAGSSHFDFTGLNAGSLPAGTFVWFGDLDSGSGSESFTLQAYGSSGLLNSAWLESAFYVYATNQGDLVQASMPEYDWSSHPGTYYFDGDNVPGNPSIGVFLRTNQDIYSLDVTGSSNFASFAIAAQTPEPGSLLLMGSGIAGLCGLLRRQLLG